MRESRVPAQASIYNLITTLMMILTLGVCLAVAYLAWNPMPRTQVAAEPTLFVFATQTPTLAGPTLNATWTASPTGTATPTATATRTPTNAPTDMPTNTAAPTLTPTVTPTRTSTPPPTLTPTINTTLTTLTPTATRPPTRTPTPGTPTATFTPSVVPTTAVAATYQQKGNTLYTKNVNGQSCANWRGVGGQVFDRNNQPVDGIRLHIINSIGTEEFYVTTSSSLPAYGAKGAYEQQTTLIGTWFIEVVDANNTVLSPRISFEPQADCSLEQSLALIYFIHN